MKNRNTKDLGENHIFTFVFSNITLFVAVFFSLNSAPQVAAIIYSLSLNLFLNWLVFYSSKKKKLKHHSLYFNDLTIGMGMLSAFVPTLLFTLLMLFLPESYAFGKLILFFAFLTPLTHVLIMKFYAWEQVFETKLVAYRMSIKEEQEVAGEALSDFLKDKDLNQAAAYLDKIDMFDCGIDAIIESIQNSRN